MTDRLDPQELLPQRAANVARQATAQKTAGQTRVVGGFVDDTVFRAAIEINLPAQSQGSGRYATHNVYNQAAPAIDFNAFSDDTVLSDAIAREAPWARDRCAALGQLAGDEAVQELARQANRNTPELKTHDRFGNRVDWVDFHPAWHQLMSLAWQHGVPICRGPPASSSPTTREPCSRTCGTRSSRARAARPAWPTPPTPASRPSRPSPSGRKNPAARATNSAAARWPTSLRW